MAESITFKPTNPSYQPHTHPFKPAETIEQLKEAVATHYGVEYEQLKLIHKGRVLEDRLTSAEAKLANGVVMLVINKKADRAKKLQVDNTIPKVPSSLSTGMGGSSPVGFGAYSMINHPQYMSAISGAVDQKNIEDIMNDPMYQSMMEDMLKDPDTLKYMIDENPMLRNMVNQNPSMKMLFQNPALMKSVLNPETLKMAREMMKNDQSNPNNSMAGLGGFGGLGAPGLGFPSGPVPQMPTSPPALQQPGMYPLGNPLLGFGSPFFGWQNPVAPPRVPTAPKEVPIEQKYQAQIKELESMGFKDREQVIKALIQSKGDVDGAIERLCLD